MQKNIELQENETYVIFDKNSSVIIFEPNSDTTVNSNLIIPIEVTDENLVASNIAISLLQKIKTDKSFINNLLNWFNARCVTNEGNETIH